MSNTTTQSTSKKKPSRVKKITLDQAEKDKKLAVEEALEAQKKEFEQEQIRSSMNTPDDVDFDEYEDTDEDETSFGTRNGAYYEDADLPDELDIFEFGKTLEDQGKDISYYIKKDNAFLVELYTATSWEELRSKHGGGKYTVAIKNSNGQWIKQRTQRVHGVPNAQKEEKQTVIPPQPNVPQIDLNETFGAMSQMFMQMQEMTQRERSRAERDEKKGMDTFNTTIFQVISEQSKNTQAMIMEMQRNNMEMLKSLNENTSRSLEKAEERNREMIREMRQSISKKDEFSTKDLLALIENSRNNGMDTMKTIMEMGELFAEKMTPDVPSVPESKDNMIGKLVNGILPLLTQAKQSAAQAAMPGLPAAHNPTVGTTQHLGDRGQHRPLQPNVRQAQAPQVPISQNPLPNRTAQGRTQAPQKSPIQGNGRYEEIRVKNNAPQGVQNLEKNTLDSLGLPSFTDRKINKPQGPHLKSVPPKEGQVASIHTLSSEELIERTNSKVKEYDATFKGGVMSDEAKEAIESFKKFMPLVRESDVYKNANKNQKLIVEMSLPIIAQYINDENITPELVAHFVIDECQNQGFGPQVLAKEFTFDFLLQIASNFGMAEEKKTWFGEFYETIKDASSSTDGIEGEEESTIS